MRSTNGAYWFALGVTALLVSACVSIPDVGSLTGDPLNPDQYRAQIVAIDAVLFEDDPLSADGRDGVANALQEIAASAGSDEANSIARTLARELRSLASGARRTRIGTPMGNSPLQHQWLRIRSSLFADAAWFRRSSSDPIESEVAAPPKMLRAATVQERVGVEVALSSIAHVIDDAKRDFPNGSDNAREELDQDVRRLGAKPEFEVDPYYRTAHAEALESLRNLRTVAGLGAGVSESSRQSLIDRAEEHLQSAQTSVDKMQPAR